MAFSTPPDRDTAPWVHPPCIAEQLEGVMDLGEAFSQALDLVRLTAAAREETFGVDVGICIGFGVGGD